MGRTALRARYIKRVKTVALYAERVEALRKIIRNKATGAQDRLLAYKKLGSMPRDVFPSRIRNLCAITYRSSSVYRDFGVSRIVLRQQASFGYMPGVFKGSL